LRNQLEEIKKPTAERPFYIDSVEKEENLEFMEGYR
jgi:hypothetical protein